jgi:glycerophosphoryl diester phosphodiesterase
MVASLQSDDVRLGARWTVPADRPLILGHRGARHAAPENTFAAFDLALAEGAQGVELDVRMNASGEVVVCHDVTLERVTEGRDRRAVHELTSRECDAVRLAGDERLPRLADVLAWAERHQACVNVELKADGRRRRDLVRAVAELTRQPGRIELVLVSCFNAALIAAHAVIAPEVPSAWLVESPRLAMLAPLVWTGNTAVHPKAALVTAERVARWKSWGRRVHVWTVNDVERARELAALGVDCLISDNPGTLRAALASGA